MAISQNASTVMFRANVIRYEMLHNIAQGRFALLFVVVVVDVCCFFLRLKFWLFSRRLLMFLLPSTDQNHTQTSMMHWHMRWTHTHIHKATTRYFVEETETMDWQTLYVSIVCTRNEFAKKEKQLLATFVVFGFYSMFRCVCLSEWMVVSAAAPKWIEIVLYVCEERLQKY